MKKVLLIVLIISILFQSNMALAQTSTVQPAATQQTSVNPATAKPSDTAKTVKKIKKAKKKAPKKTSKKTSKKTPVKVVAPQAAVRKASRTVRLLHSEIYIKPLYTKAKTDTAVFNKIKVRIKFSGLPIEQYDTITFSLDKRDLKNNPVLDSTTKIIFLGTMDSIMDLVFYLKTSATQDTLTHDAIGIMTISDQPDSFVKIGFTSIDTSSKAKPSSQMVRPGMAKLIANDPIILQSTYSPTKSYNEIQKDITVKLFGKYDSTAARFVFVMDTGLLSNNAYINPNDTVKTLTEWEWKNAVDNNEGIYTFHLHIKSNNIKDTFGSPQSTFISIKSIPEESQEVRLVSYNPNKPFWVELGSNFDLLNGLQANNLYGGVFMDTKDIQRIFGKRFQKNLTLFGGVYESKNISNDQSTFSNFQYLDNSVFTPPAANDTFAIIHRDTGTVSKTTSITSLGVFFEPQVRLTKKLSNENGLHVYAALWAEIVWQRIVTDFDYSKTGNFDNETVNRNDSIVAKMGYKVTSINNDYRSHFLGLGLPMLVKQGTYNLYINPVVGWSTQVGIPVDSSSFFSNKQVSQYWRGFYLVQFRLNDDQYGFAFTGEIRGVIATSGNYKPSISLALSKKFDLSKLIEFTNN